MVKEQNLRSVVQASIATASTDELAKKLLEEFDELNRRFYLGDYRPTELVGGRFGEAAFRICQYVCNRTYTPLNKRLPRIDQLVNQLEQTPSSKADETFRLHIPRTLRLIYDLRNKRDVAHLGTNISPNFTDSSLVLTCSEWIVSEFVRIFHKCDSGTAQNIVNNLLQRRVPLIWEEGEILRVLDPSLQYMDQVLIILYHMQPNWVENRNIFKWVGYSNFSTFQKSVLYTLHNQAMIHIEGTKSKILPPGNNRVEEIFEEQRNAI